MNTLLDIAKMNGSDAVVGLIDETTKLHPEITSVAARTIRGLMYKTLVRTGLPTAGFRNAGEGATPSNSVYENRLVETYILNPMWQCDRAVADKHEDGAEAFIALEGEGMVEAAFQTLARQFYYGAANGGDAKGHPGLIDAYDSTNMVVDAGGTTANTGSSVWLVKTDVKNVQWVYGADGSLDLSDVTTQRVADPNNANKYLTMYLQELLAYPGLQVGSIRGVCRIKKLTADVGHTLTDAVLAQAIAKFQAGIRPDLILMGRRSRSQLQQSRTVTLFGNSSGKPDGGNATVAPTPTEYEGIPIKATDAILDTESLTL
jgi:hypothetical protein